MKSYILKSDHDALIKLNKSMTPQERLVAFYHHSLLMSRLARAGQKIRKKVAKIAHASASPHF